MQPYSGSKKKALVGRSRSRSHRIWPNCSSSFAAVPVNWTGTAPWGTAAR